MLAVCFMTRLKECLRLSKETPDYFLTNQILKTMTRFFAALPLLALFAFNTNPVTEVEVLKVNTEESFIEWKARKVTGSHNGKITLKEGSLEMENGELTGGSFVIDMTTIAVEDLQGNSKAKLEGHLNSADFFDTANHPTATFEITEVEGSNGEYNITGDLTIKGNTNPVSFIATINKLDDKNMAFASITVDRSKYDVRYGSTSFFDNLGDKAIYNNFNLDVTLVANK